MSNYTFTDPTKTTFKAIKFNGMFFATGRGLYIHFMKYHPSIIPQQEKNSKSKVPFTLENFAEATRKHRKWFKGIRFEYVDVEKIYRDEIKAHSKFGEGWWPDRKILLEPEKDYMPLFANFAMNYENGRNYFRRLGKGNNIPNNRRLEFQTGVEFTTEGFSDMVRAYQKFIGEEALFALHFPETRCKIYTLNKLIAQSPIPKLRPVDWFVWTIKNRKDREEYIKNAVR